MLFTGFLVVFLFSSCWAADNGGSDTEIPLVTASRDNSNEEEPFVLGLTDNSNDAKVSNLLPDLRESDVPPLTTLQSTESRGRLDIEIQDDKPSGGYIYRPPSNPLILPPFTTLDARQFAEEITEAERLPRSLQYRPPYFGYRPPPPFIPGFIPPNNIRPLPALYGRPSRF